MKRTVLLLSLFLFVYSRDTLVLTTQVWPPYQTVSDGLLGGVAVELVREICDSLELTAEITAYPWKRAQYMVETGEADAFFLASQNDRRDFFATASVPLMDQNWCWYYRTKSAHMPGDSLFKEEAKVSATMGSNMFKWLKENGYHITVSNQKSEQLLKLLLAERLDAVLANSQVMKEFMAAHSVDSSIVACAVLKEKPLSVYFSKRFLEENEGFLKRFNEMVVKVNAAKPRSKLLGQ